MGDDFWAGVFAERMSADYSDFSRRISARMRGTERNNGQLSTEERAQRVEQENSELRRLIGELDRERTFLECDLAGCLERAKVYLERGRQGDQTIFATDDHAIDERARLYLQGFTRRAKELQEQGAPVSSPMALLKWGNHKFHTQLTKRGVLPDPAFS